MQLSLYLVHSKYEIFLLAFFSLFKEELINLTHFEGSCVLIVKLRLSPGYLVYQSYHFSRHILAVPS